MIFFGGILAIFCILMFSHGTQAASDCEEKAGKVSINFTECCKFPEFATDQEFQEMSKAIVKEGVDLKKDPDLYSCTFFEKKKLLDKDNEIDKSACIKFVNDVVKDSGFKELVDKTINTCYDETSKHAEAFQKDSKIPKEKCLVKFDFMADCVKLEMFAKCPNDAWVKDEKIKEPCEFVQKFVNQCYEDDKAMEIFEQNQNGA